MSGPVQQGGTYHNPDMHGISCVTYMGATRPLAKSTYAEIFT